MSLPDKENKSEDKIKEEGKQQEHTADINDASETTLIPTALMPELEALVSKNPNRLIGCGG